MKITGAVAFILFLGVTSAEAQDAMMRASCVEGSNIVYREDFPAADSDRRRTLIAAANPGAMCLFLDVAGRTETVPTGTHGLPDALLQAAAGAVMEGDEGLASALAIIASGSIGDRYPEGFELGRPPVPALNQTGSRSEHHVNLTIGVYDSVPLTDVMAHWKLMQASSPILSKMTPSLDHVQNVTVLSVERVPDNEAGDLCEEAAKAGAGCLAYY